MVQYGIVTKLVFNAYSLPGFSAYQLTDTLRKELKKAVKISFVFTGEYRQKRSQTR